MRWEAVAAKLERMGGGKDREDVDIHHWGFGGTLK
jgi:hypothetical protein